MNAYIITLLKGKIKGKIAFIYRTRVVKPALHILQYRTNHYNCTRFNLNYLFFSAIFANTYALGMQHMGKNWHCLKLCSLPLSAISS